MAFFPCSVKIKSFYHQCIPVCKTTVYTEHFNLEQCEAFDCILRNPFLPRVVMLPSSLFINSFLSPKERNNVSGYIFFYPENLRHIRAPVMGCRFAVGQSFITSMKSDIDWRSRPRQGCPCAVVVAMLLHTPGACQELTRGAKDGKLGVTTTQLPDHSNLFGRSN